MRIPHSKNLATKKVTERTKRDADDNDPASTVAPLPQTYRNLAIFHPNFCLSILPERRASKTMLDSGRTRLKNPVNSSDHVGKLGNDSGAWEAMSFDTRTKLKPALNHEIFRSWNGKQIHLRDEGLESGLCLSPQRSPQYYRSNYRSLSPSSKSQAIACGQRELMEMVNHMPESCYELSLRDLVEQPMVLGRQEEIITDERGLNLSSDREFFTSSKNKKESRALINRSTRGIENRGFYLKMGFPRSLGTTKKKKKNDCALNTSAKVSPKPPPSADKEWWKKRFSVLSESDSVGSSINSGSVKSGNSRSSSSGSNNNRRRDTRRHGNRGCWSWIYPKYNEANE